MWCTGCHSSAILLTSCSTFTFTPPPLHSDCQPHPSPQDSSTHLLSIRLAQYKDSCSPHTHCQIVLSLLHMQDSPALLPRLISCCQPCLNPGNFLSLLSLDHEFCFCPPGFSLSVPVAVWRFPALSQQCEFL